MKISKVRDVKTPIRSTIGSAGIDFFIPNDFKKYFLKKNESVLIPSGIHVKVPNDYALIAFNKSGIAVKRNLICGACVIDSDYQGEVHIHLINVGNEIQELNPGDKIIQFLLIPINYDKIEIIDFIDLYKNENSERGIGGFGSTDFK